MHNASMSEVKTIGTSGQLYLGREFAGRNVVIDQPEPGVWVVRTATVIPDHELWLHQPAERHKLEEAMAWAEHHPVPVTTTEAVEGLKQRKETSSLEQRVTHT